MSLNVNLSVEQEKKEPISQVAVAAIFFAVVSVAVFGGVLFYNILLSGQIEGFEQRLQQVEEEKEQIITSQESYMMLAGKVRSIEEILENRIPIEARLMQIFSQFPNGIEVERVEASADFVRIGLESSQLSLLNNFFEEDLHEISGGNEDVERVDVLSFGRSDDGESYVASILITYRSQGQ